MPEPLTKVLQPHGQRDGIPLRHAEHGGVDPAKRRRKRARPHRAPVCRRRCDAPVAIMRVLKFFPSRNANGRMGWHHSAKMHERNHVRRFRTAGPCHLTVHPAGSNTAALGLPDVRNPALTLAQALWALQRPLFSTCTLAELCFLLRLYIDIKE